MPLFWSHCFQSRERVGNGGKFLDSQSFTARLHAHPGALERGVDLLAIVGAEAVGEGVGQGLAPLPEGRAHAAEHQRLVAHGAGLLCARCERYDAARHLRARHEALGRDVKELLHLAVPVDVHGEGAVVLRARRGGKALRDLALYHDGDAPEHAGVYERREQRRGHAVGQVCADYGAQPARALTDYLRQIQLRRVAPDDLDVVIPAERLCQNAAEGAVQLDGHDPACALRQLAREAAHAGADLQREGGAVRAGGLGYAPGNRRLDEEVLPQRLGEAEAVPLQQGLYFTRTGQVHSAHLTHLAVPMAVAQALCSGTK